MVYREAFEIKIKLRRKTKRGIDDFKTKKEKEVGLFMQLTNTRHHALCLSEMGYRSRGDAVPQDIICQPV